MHYRAYSGPKGSGDVSPLEKLSWARHLENTGRVPLLIEGEDGTRVNRRAIADALGVAMREQLNR